MCLTLGADIRLAAPSAVFCGAGITNGLTGCELGVSWLLPRAIGTSRANEIILTGRKVDATEAERIGLVSEVVVDNVVDRAVAIGAGMCELSPLGLTLTKDTLWGSLEVGSLASRRRPGEPDPAPGRVHRELDRGRGRLQGEAAARVHGVGHGQGPTGAANRSGAGSTATPARGQPRALAGRRRPQTRRTRRSTTPTGTPCRPGSRKASTSTPTPAASADGGTWEIGGSDFRDCAASQLYRPDGIVSDGDADRTHVRPASAPELRASATATVPPPSGASWTPPAGSWCATGSGTSPSRGRPLRRGCQKAASSITSPPGTHWWRPWSPASSSSSKRRSPPTCPIRSTPEAVAPGAFARAYVRATFESVPPGEERLGAALLAAAAAEPALLVPLQSAADGWQARMVDDGLDAGAATVIRMACDGVWLCDLFGLAPPTGPLRRCGGRRTRATHPGDAMIRRDVTGESASDVVIAADPHPHGHGLLAVDGIDVDHPDVARLHPTTSVAPICWPGWSCRRSSRPASCRSTRSDVSPTGSAGDPVLLAGLALYAVGQFRLPAPHRTRPWPSCCVAPKAWVRVLRPWPPSPWCQGLSPSSAGDGRSRRSSAPKSPAWPSVPWSAPLSASVTCGSSSWPPGVVALLAGDPGGETRRTDRGPGTTIQRHQRSDGSVAPVGPAAVEPVDDRRAGRRRRTRPDHRGLRHLLDVAAGVPGGRRLADRGVVDAVRRAVRVGRPAERLAGRPRRPARCWCSGDSVWPLCSARPIPSSTPCPL